MSARVLVPAVCLGAVLAAAWLGGCATCRPEEPRVQPRAGGGASIGTHGVTPTLGLGLDLSNLFCREPDPETRPQPGPADEPIPDAEPAAGAAPQPDGARP